MKSYLPSLTRQDGLALLMAMIFLLVLTMIGLAGVNSAVMQGRMSMNTLSTEQVFRNVESAMNRAEQVLLSEANLNRFRTQYPLQTTSSDPWEDCVENICPIVPDSADDGLWTAAGNNLQASYHIQFIGYGVLAERGEAEGGGDDEGGGGDEGGDEGGDDGDYGEDPEASVPIPNIFPADVCLAGANQWESCHAATTSEPVPYFRVTARSDAGGNTGRLMLQTIFAIQ